MARPGMKACEQINTYLLHVFCSHRLHGHVAPTYESASTRKFRLGRTETIRAASLAAKAFCESMQSKQASVSINLKVHQTLLMLNAAARHTDFKVHFSTNIVSILGLGKRPITHYIPQDFQSSFFYRD